MELHGFADASLKEYRCCVYFRFLAKDGLYNVSLVSVQSQVALIKPQSIPRLELQAALLLTKLADKVYNDLKITLTIKSVTLYTNSTITFSWIRTTKNKLEAFAEKRINETRKLSDTSMSCYVSTSIIPADLISRRCLISELSGSSFWFDGPKLLWGDFDFDNTGSGSGSSSKNLNSIMSCRNFL